LVLTTANDVVAEKSIRNLDNANVLRAMYLNVRDLLSHDRLVISQSALLEIESYLGVESK
jgi:ribosomal protein L4